MNRSDDLPAWGVRHTIALALALLDLKIVHRATLRALLPAGVVKRRSLSRSVAKGNRSSSRNRTSDAFGVALKRLEEDGLISRGTEYVLVRNRRGLLDLATDAQLPVEARIFAVKSAIGRVNADLRESTGVNPKATVQRRQELLQLKRLMEEGYGSTNWSGRGSVRFVPRSRPL